MVCCHRRKNKFPISPALSVILKIGHRNQFSEARLLRLIHFNHSFRKKTTCSVYLAHNLVDLLHLYTTPPPPAKSLVLAAV